MFIVATWNCATLNDQDRIAALHNPSTDLGKAQVVFLQEMRLAAPHSLPRSNPFLRLHHPFANRAHQAVLGKDAGILIRNTTWQIEETGLYDYATYARVQIPETEPAVGKDIRTLHLWSIHAPPDIESRTAFWNADVPGLARLDAAVSQPHTAAIIGADWNAIVSPTLDEYPPRSSRILLPLGQLAQAGLVDAFRTLYPTSVAYTRHNVVRGEMTGARRIDSIWTSHSLIPLLHSVSTRPSASDHSVVSVHLKSATPSTDHGPGVWRLHRHAHHQPGFSIRMQGYADQLDRKVHLTAVQAWFAYVERLRTKASDISTSLSQKATKREAERNRLVAQLNSLDIRRDNGTRALFLSLLARLRQMEHLETTAELSTSSGLFERNMLQPTSWIIPRLESRAFATMATLEDDQGQHTTIESKLKAVHRFYTTLFTPKPQDRFSEEASSILLTSIQRRLSPSTRFALEAPSKVEELQTALARAREMSAPGMDGVTYPLIQCTSDASLQRLCDFANALLRGHHLPEGEPSLRGVLLPKKGDLSQLRNYRPLSIAAATFRILGAAVATRLQTAAQEVISVSQTGFILGRHSARNVITLYLLQHAVATGLTDHPIWVLNLDQQKAYDRVRHAWLLECLEAYGFGPRFLTYIREIYRHPSLQHCVEGFFTDPIELQCGILQGDPMSCLLYNFSLQPMLDFAQYHHHAGTQLRWDPAAPMVVSSLAFADDVLLIVNNKQDLAKFLDALDLYEMASNAKVNEDKSQAFYFARSHADAGDGDLLPEDIPFPVIGDSDAEIVHLGYPFRLDGSIPWDTLEKRLAAIQAKVNILCTTRTTLFGRARICNSFLLSKLWHSLRLCPIPQHIQRRVNAIINPFLFLGRRNWIKHEYAVAPRHLGGLGIIDTGHMCLALLGQLVAKLLASTEPIGAQFRQALQQHLWTEYEAIPAHLILRRGKPWIKMANLLTAQKSFMCRVVYTLTQLRLTLEPNWDDISVPELLSLPFHNDMFGFTWPKDIHADSMQCWERNGLRVWGDWLWYNPNGKGVLAHPNAIPAAYPLVPPSAAGIKNNYVATRGHPDESAKFSDAAGRLLPHFWREMWPQLHPTVARKLLDISKHYRIHPDHSTSKKNPRPHDRPFDIDTVGLPFPWRFAKLADKPIADYTVRHARLFLTATEPIVPDWAFESTSEQWKQVWESFNQHTVLSSQAASDVFLFLHRRPWLAQKPRHDRILENYNELNDHTTSARVPFLNRDLAASEDAPETVNDAYETNHVFGVANCMLCGAVKDSAAHGYVECPSIQQNVWQQVLPTLRKLVSESGGRAVPLDVKSIVLGWPDLKMPKALRSRLLLWRDLTIHLLAMRRYTAISAGLQNDHAPVLTLEDFGRELAALVVRTITDAFHRCTTAQRPAFIARWIDRGSLLQERNGDLVFYSRPATVP